MWTPPERVRHSLGEARWPSAAEAARARLFSPLAEGRLALAERTWVPAMVPWRASPEGLVTPEVLATMGASANNISSCGRCHSGSARLAA